MKAFVVVGICAALGILTGIVVANWWFRDPDVVMGARAIFGLVGLVVGTGIGRLFTTRHADT